MYVGLGRGGCYLRTDGQSVESFLKAIFRNARTRRISALFPTDFINILGMTVTRFTAFKYTEMNIRPFILIMESYNYSERDKLTL